MPIKAKDCCSLNVELTKFAEFHESVLLFFFTKHLRLSIVDWKEMPE